MLAEEDTQESQDRLSNLAELLSAAADYEATDESPTLGGFLDRAALLTDADQVKGDAPVVLMTLHAAKGLEFDRVFLVGLEEGLVPHSRSLDSDDGLEEERRLCYVGMTRAMERLTLSLGPEPRRFRAAPARGAEPVPGRDPRGEPARHGRQAVPLGGLARGAGRHPRRRAGLGPARGAGGHTVAAAPAGASEFRPGVRVRHPLFGVGTVLRSDGDGEELKLTVSFAGVGAKKLVARYAGLEALVVAAGTARTGRGRSLRRTARPAGYLGWRLCTTQRLPAGPGPP